jgi:hypothetical protein
MHFNGIYAYGKFVISSQSKSTTNIKLSMSNICHGISQSEIKHAHDLPLLPNRLPISVRVQNSNAQVGQTKCECALLIGLNRGFSRLHHVVTL